MNLVLLNFVWSGVLIGESFIRFWYIIPATIVIEMVIIKIDDFSFCGENRITYLYSWKLGFWSYWDYCYRMCQYIN